MRKRLGIIGGVGPAATARLFTRVVDMTQASCDQEHLDVLLRNCPTIPDRTAYLLGREGADDFVPVMSEIALELEGAGCQILAMPCNTAHARISLISEPLTCARFVNMPKEAAVFARDLGCTQVGILATDGTLAAGVYTQALADLGICAVRPGDTSQKRVMSIIYDDVKAGRKVPEGKFESVCEELVEAGCDGLILGCTEFSVIGAPTHFAGVAVIDALDVLAWRCVQECGAAAFDLRGLFESG